MADITIQGNATADGALKFLPNGSAVLNFDIAENHRKKQGDTWVDDGTTFYRVAVWGKQAEILADHIRRGSRVLVAGRFRGGQFTSKDGQEVKTYEVTANHVGIIPKSDQQGGQAQQANRYVGDQSGGTWGANPNAQQADPWAASSMAQQNSELPF